MKMVESYKVHEVCFIFLYYNAAKVFLCCIYFFVNFSNRKGGIKIDYLYVLYRNTGDVKIDNHYAQNKEYKRVNN
jgi:hypothetical protein